MSQRKKFSTVSLEFTGYTRMDTNCHNIEEVLDGSTFEQIQESIDVLKRMFGENFERLEEWKLRYGDKAYISNIAKGKCRCGSCDDIYEWWVCETKVELVDEPDVEIGKYDPSEHKTVILDHIKRMNRKYDEYQ